MRIVFISDAHLKGLDDPNQDSVVRFLDGLERVDTLIILGDLFDFWTGFNEVVRRNYLPVLESLIRLRKKGVEIIYLEGNHDFGMGSFFTDTLNARVYPESADVVLDGKRFYLAHGDMVHMTAGYRLWRGFLRSPIFRVAAKAATPKVVWNIALGVSANSRKKARDYSHNPIEARLAEFAEMRIAEGFDFVVLAHSHMPGVHKKGNGTYANPGSFIGKKSYLVYEGGGIRLEKI